MDSTKIDPATPESAKLKTLSPAAARALAEAEARRKAQEAEPPLPPEWGGRLKGLEPVRYGDWEKKGLAVDF